MCVCVCVERISNPKQIKTTQTDRQMIEKEKLSKIFIIFFHLFFHVNKVVTQTTENQISNIFFFVAKILSFFNLQFLIMSKHLSCLLVYMHVCVCALNECVVFKNFKFFFPSLIAKCVNYELENKKIL